MIGLFSGSLTIFLRFLVGPFALIVLCMSAVLFRDKSKKDLFILFGVGALMLGFIAGL